MLNFYIKVSAQGKVTVPSLLPWTQKAAEDLTTHHFTLPASIPVTGCKCMRWRHNKTKPLGQSQEGATSSRPQRADLQDWGEGKGPSKAPGLLVRLAEIHPAPGWETDLVCLDLTGKPQKDNHSSRKTEGEGSDIWVQPLPAKIPYTLSSIFDRPGRLLKTSQHVIMVFPFVICGIGIKRQSLLQGLWLLLPRKAE